MSVRSAKDKAYRERNREKIREYERRRRADGRRNQYNRGNYRERRPFRYFVGVDGEGRENAAGRHCYFMLRAGDHALWKRDGDERIRTGDALEFLSNLSPDNIYVAFFFDYDVTKILEDLPWSKFDKLVHRAKRVRKIGGWFPVDYGDYQFDWFPRKEFKVRRYLGQDDQGKHYSPWIIIHDVGTFFQTSFIKTIETWNIGTPYLREKIAEGKNLRAEFAQVTDEYVDQYNKWECDLLAELMEEFRSVCESVGYVPRKWQGPGLIAEAAMTRHGIPKTSEIPILQEADPDGVAAFGRRAYYGPKFETSLVGPTEVPCVQFDINSAFPAAMLHLPCLIHGEWERRTGKREIESDELSICFLRFGWKPDRKRFLFGGFPVRRKDGSIHFPFNGKGWYWSFEARAAIHQDVTVYDSWVYASHCDCRPFSFLEQIYEERKLLGKSGKGIVLKLVMNSMYGKLVQTIGSPQYSNPIWASYITAWTRTCIADGIHGLGCCRDPDVRIPCGYDVFMIASDAIYTRSYPSYSLPISKRLGDWDMEVHGNGLFLVQPGVYFDPLSDDKEGVYKTRGIPKRMVVAHKMEFMEGYERILATRDVHAGDVHLPFSVFVGIRQALARHSTKQLGQFVGYVDSETNQPGRRTSFEWTTKRRPQPLPDIYTMSRGIRTAPYTGTYNGKHDGIPIQTVPYSRDIGGLLRRNAERLAFEDQPDWIQTQ